MHGGRPRTAARPRAALHRIGVAGRLRFAAFAAATATALVLVGLPVPAVAAGNTFYVDQTNGQNMGCEAPGATACASIGAALGLASDGDTIVIAAANYSDTLVIDKSITLKGDPEGRP